MFFTEVFHEDCQQRFWFVTFDFDETSYDGLAILLPATGIDQAGATGPLNLAFSSLYSSGFWLMSWKGKRVAECFLFFLASYQRLAYLALNARKNRFQMIPKLHYFHHIALDMLRQSSNGPWVMNCLATSVQQQEDFVGRPSRVSRRVDVRRLHRNVISRSLICQNGHWTKPTMMKEAWTRMLYRKPDV